MANVFRKCLLSPMQKGYCTTSPIFSSLPRPPPFTIQSNGYASESALSLSKNRQTNKKGAQRSESLLNSLKAYGFNETHIKKLIKTNASVLQCRVETNFKPKLEWFIENGFTGTILTDLISLNPYIITWSLDFKLKPIFLLLKQFLDTNEKIVTAVKRSGCWLSNNNTLEQNIQYLISEGVPVKRISYLLTAQPRAMLQSRYRIAYAVKTVKDSGLAPDAFRFIHLLRAVIQLTESKLKRKLEVFKSLGWSDEQLLNTIKNYPICLSYSEENLRSKMEFYLNTMKFEREAVIARPLLMTLSVDKRIRPRYEVMNILGSKKLVKDGLKMIWVMEISEERFLKMYVTKHVDKVPGLLDMYCSIINQRKKTDSAKQLAS
ncbi:hypothetical protein SLE2022_066690 [Rubroshorea leprosula]